MFSKNYDSIHYWNNIKEKTDLFKGAFNNNQLNESSIFFNSVIFNNGELLDSWAYYPNVKALVGFIKYVFIPSCYLNILVKDEEEAVVIDVEHPDTIIDIFENVDKLTEKEDLEDMGEYVGFLTDDLKIIDSLWKLEDDECLKKLRIFLKSFNEKWCKNSDNIFFYLNIYDSPKEIADYLINGYEEDGVYDLFNKDIDYSKEEFLNIVNDVYGNKFLEKKFIELLNNKLPVLI